jgi:hypothetical protein
MRGLSEDTVSLLNFWASRVLDTGKTLSWQLQ